jgi:monoamine oxidase
VVAVPTNTLDAIEFHPGLSATKQKALAAGHACLPYKVQMIVENVPDGLFALGTSPFQMLLSDFPLSDGSHLVTGFGAASVAEIDITDRGAVERALQAYAPGARLLAVDAHDWIADPWSRGGWRMNPPGWAQRFAEVMHEPEGGRLFFAGTDVAESVMAGWMEGAVVSGYQAADRVTALLGRG